MIYSLYIYIHFLVAHKLGWKAIQFISKMFHKNKLSDKNYNKNKQLIMQYIAKQFIENNCISTTDT